MDPTIIGLAGFVALFILVFAGMPIAFSMALVGFIGFSLIGNIAQALAVVSNVPYSSVAFYIIGVIPAFLLMSEFALVSGIVTEAYDATNKWLGHLPGGLAMATIVGCAGFAACCGSSVACSAVIVPVAFPEMERYKYAPKLSLGSIAAGGTLGILIPPSTPLVVYGLLAEQSIGKLFIAGIVPGLIIALLFMLFIYVRVRTNPALGPPAPKTGWREKFVSIKGIWLVGVLVVFVLGGMWGGIFTPGEAGGMGAFGSFLIALFKRRLNMEKVAFALKKTVRTTAMILTVMIGANIFSTFMAVTQLPVLLANFVSGLTLPPLTILIVILLLYLVLGCIVDPLSMVVLTLPVLLPTVAGLGYDLIWFGILITVMTELALITPPIGVNVFVISGMVKEVPMYTIFRGVLPFIFAMFLFIILVIAFPQIALFMPNAMR
jgi:C4-dicarboxylate transporter DctM subunit